MVGKIVHMWLVLHWFGKLVGNLLGMQFARYPVIWMIFVLWIRCQVQLESGFFFFLRKKRQVYMGLEFEGTVINGKEVLTTGGVLGNCCLYINSQETERDEWQGCLSFPFYLIL